MNKARETILRLLVEGKITVEEAEELLDAITAKGPFDNLFGGRRASAEEKAGKRRGTEGTGYLGRFDFHFPWDEPGWKWPWEREGWQWPWEKHPWSPVKTESAFEVPEDAQLRIKSGDGNLRICGTGEPSLKLRSTTPLTTNKVMTANKTVNISLEDGDFDVDVPSRVTYMETAQNRGNLSVRELKLDLITKLADGIISASDITGKIQASLNNGNIWLSNVISTDIAAKVDSGSISLNMLPVVSEGSFSLKVNTGIISLSLPPDSKCQVIANVRSGNIYQDLPPDSVEMVDKADNYLNMKLNGGGADFILSVGTGNITITNARQ